MWWLRFQSLESERLELKANSPLACEVTVGKLVASSGLSFINCKMGTIGGIRFIGLL